ncbi:MAG: phospho-sugar mutase [Myxococcales bacterium]|nr:phospho-sugar mutase [Myxococcales bacterium]
MTASKKELLEHVGRWIARDPDQGTRDELQALVTRVERDDERALDDLRRRFGARLDFGTAGLRGVLGGGPSRMNRLVVRETSAGLGRYLLAQIPEAAQRGIVLGYDGRRMSDVFAADAATVFAALGLRVFLGDRPLPTPICAYALAHERAAAAVVITASHNPPEYNGYKVYWENGAQIIPPHDAGIAASIDEAASAAEIPWTDLEQARAEGRVVPLGDEIIERYLGAISELSVHPREEGERAKLRIAYTPLHGVGALYTEAALARAGFDAVHTVASQREPDGTFPTVRFPNPEEAGAMDSVLALAREVDAPLAIANDPDADRLAVAARDAHGEYRMLSGDQLGVLLGADRIDAAVRRGEAEGAVVGCSIVSSQMLAALASARGVASYESLTGFKWITNVAMQRERERGERFIFGYEEALGYTVGRVVRDKDGISAALCFAEMAAALHAAGSTVLERLEALYRELGLFLTVQKSLALDAAAAEGPSAGEKLRAARPSHIAGRAVERWADVAAGERYDAKGASSPLELPPSDVLIYWLAGGARVIVRPSGTEPKLKCYYELRGEIGADEAFDAAQVRVRAELDALVEAHQAELAAL